MKVVGVRLNDNGKVYYFNDNKLELVVSDKVIVETEKGLQYGVVVLFVSDDFTLSTVSVVFFIFGIENKSLLYSITCSSAIKFFSSKILLSSFNIFSMFDVFSLDCCI